MAEEKVNNGSGMSQQRYEEEKRRIALALFQETLRFTQLDNALNEKLVELMGVVVAHVKADPSALNSGQDIEQILKELKRKSEQGGGTAGGDIVGGGLLDGLIDLIKAIGGLAKDEKDFILQIIRLVFCGC